MTANVSLTCAKWNGGQHLPKATAAALRKSRYAGSPKKCIRQGTTPKNPIPTTGLS